MNVKEFQNFVESVLYENYPTADRIIWEVDEKRTKEYEYLFGKITLSYRFNNELKRVSFTDEEIIDTDLAELNSIVLRKLETKNRA